MGRKLIGQNTMLLAGMVLLSVVIYQLIPLTWQQAVMQLLRARATTVLGQDISILVLLLAFLFFAVLFRPLLYLYYKARRMFTIACRAQRWQYVKTGLLCVATVIPGAIKAICIGAKGAAASVLGSSLNAPVFSIFSRPVRVWHIMTAIAVIAVIATVRKRP